MRRRCAGGRPAADQREGKPPARRHDSERFLATLRSCSCDTFASVLCHLALKARRKVRRRFRLNPLAPAAQRAPEQGPSRCRAGCWAGQASGRVNSKTGAGRTLLRRRPAHRLTRRAGVPSFAELCFGLCVGLCARCLRITPAVRRWRTLGGFSAGSRRVLGAPLARRRQEKRSGAWGGAVLVGAGSALSLAFKNLKSRWGRAGFWPAGGGGHRTAGERPENDRRTTGERSAGRSPDDRRTIGKWAVDGG